MDSIQAAVLDVKLRYIDQFNKERDSIAKKYIAQIEKLDLDIKLPVVGKGNCHVWHLFVIQVDNRDALLAHMHSKGIGVGIHYPIPIHQLGAYAELGALNTISQHVLLLLPGCFPCLFTQS